MSDSMSARRPVSAAASAAAARRSTNGCACVLSISMIEPAHDRRRRRGSGDREEHTQSYLVAGTGAQQAGRLSMANRV